jgi:isopropylmalate/homocitrate/citramalate synthase
MTMKPITPGGTLAALRGRPITVVEVGPRDGLQNERVIVSTRQKVEFIDRLSRAGLPVIEVSAFVSARRVPQMADAEAALAGIARRPGTRYSALVPNLAGLDRAIAAGVTDIAVFAATTDTFSRRNINRSVDESLREYRTVCERAAAAGMRVRGYLSTAFGCPYEGEVSPARVADLTRRMLDLGVFEVAVSDTIGIAHPAQVQRVLENLQQAVLPEQIALHFHDTRGTALANVLAALMMGVSTFDASAGGLGGCPFAPGAAGNLATDDLVYLLDGLGAQTGVSLAALSEASAFIGALLDHPLPSRYAQAAATTMRE